LLEEGGDKVKTFTVIFLKREEAFPILSANIVDPQVAPCQTRSKSDRSILLLKKKRTRQKKEKKKIQGGVKAHERAVNR